MTGVELFLGTKVLCMFRYEIFTPVGRGGEKGGIAHFKTKHTEPFTQEIPSALYCTPKGRGGGKGRSANFKTKHTEPAVRFGARIGLRSDGQEVVGSIPAMGATLFSVLSDMIAICQAK